MALKVYPNRQRAQIAANVKNAKSRKYKWIVSSLTTGGYIVHRSDTQILGGAR